MKRGMRVLAAAAAAALFAIGGPAVSHAAPPSLTGPTDLGTAIVFTQGTPMTFTATNLTGAPAALGSSGGTLSNFAGLWSTFAGAKSCQTDASGNIPDGGTCTFQVVALPYGVGTHSGDALTFSFCPVTAGVCANTNTILLSSTGVAFTVTPSSQDLGSVGVGSIGTPTVLTVTRGPGVAISGVQVSGANADDFLVTSNSCADTTSATCEIHLRFAPSATGARSATVTITSAASFADLHTVA